MPRGSGRAHPLSGPARPTACHTPSWGPARTCPLPTLQAPRPYTPLLLPLPSREPAIQPGSPGPASPLAADSQDPALELRRVYSCKNHYKTKMGQSPPPSTRCAPASGPALSGSGRAGHVPAHGAPASIKCLIRARSQGHSSWLPRAIPGLAPGRSSEAPVSLTRRPRGTPVGQGPPSQLQRLLRQVEKRGLAL